MVDESRDDATPNDPAAPVFFLSYANARRSRNLPSGAPDRDHAVKRLFDELTEDLHQLIAFKPGQDAGFMDVTMNGGQRWRPKLFRSAGTCQILVCLLSENYLNSEWCAQEFDIFLQRRITPKVAGESDEETCVVPVTWAPMSTRLPPILSELQRFNPSDLPAEIQREYRQVGMLGLLRNGNERAFVAVTFHLAMLIQKLHASHEVEHRISESTTGLRRSFAEFHPDELRLRSAAAREAK